MKKVGIIGGLGPESTVAYYQSIIHKFQEQIGSKEVLPELLINSISMYKVFQMITDGQTDELIDYLANAGRKLAVAGADFVVLSGNTPHIVFNQVQQQVQVPMISIIEETCIRAEELDVTRIGLIGTRFTMENDFFVKPFHTHNKEVIVPTASEQDYIHKKIVKELENGIVKEETKAKFIDIIQKMVKQDQIQAIILGCTELPMIIKEEDIDLPQLNTTDIHIRKIVETIFLGKNKG